MAKTRQKDIGDMMDESEAAANAFPLTEPPATVPMAPGSPVAAPKQRAKPRAPDPEVRAISRIHEILRGLSEETAYRVAKYVMEREQALASAHTRPKMPLASDFADAVARYADSDFKGQDKFTVAEATDGNAR